MRKKLGLYICILVLAVGMVGCGTNKSSETKPTAVKVAEQKTTEPSQAEINEKIKKEAVKADFVEINGYEAANAGKSYYVEGTVSNVDNTNNVLHLFTVTTKEGDGAGMYDILNFSDVSVVEGDKVKVYGKLDGVKNEKGMIQISGNVIEK